MLDTLEKFYVYRKTKNGHQIFDRLTVQSYPIFETLVQHSLHGGQHLCKQQEHQHTVTRKGSTSEKPSKSVQ